MHDALIPVSDLIGLWRGHGHGEYPTLEPFDYEDELTFSDVGKPFLTFAQRTWIAGEGRHLETGYWRFPAPGVVEYTIAIPTGQTELGVGTWAAMEDGAIEIIAEGTVLNTPTAKLVHRTIRRLRVAAGVLSYEFEMEAVGQPMTLHLRSRLELRAGRAA